jgi:hypothetical protein
LEQTRPDRRVASGGRVKLNPWDDKVEIVKAQPVAITSARDKMPFEVTPFYPRLSRYSSGRACGHHSSGARQPATTTARRQSHAGELSRLSRLQVDRSAGRDRKQFRAPGLCLFEAAIQERSCVLFKKFILAVTVVLLVVSSAALAQTLTPLEHQPPDGVIISFQLTDGTVMVQGNNCSDWWKLTPDITGSYVNGTWTQLASLPSGYAPYAMPSAVLADGRLIIEGGEYNLQQLYAHQSGRDLRSVTNTWTTGARPKGWNYIGDSPSLVLPNGDYVIGNKLTKQMRELNPKTMKWTSLVLEG